MVFTSPAFIFLFLPVVLALHAATPARARNMLLLAASLLFYACGEAGHLWLLGTLIAANWLAGLALARPEPALRRAALAGAILCDLGALAGAKYAAFLAANLRAIGIDLPGLAALAHSTMALPLGISFYVFHALSYVVDVYRGTARPRRNPFDFALYICFFPQLIAGPIVRYHDIEAMLDRRRITIAIFASGIERLIIGMGKKMLLANPLGQIADPVFAAAAGHGLTQGAAWIGVIAYALQIYFDFSGYSDMAIGLARMFGFHFLENFNYPYIAASVQEFWRRWHISLSNWFRDYLYIPLGGSRHGRPRTYANLVIVFLLCGLWHGAQWNFVLWGALHGAFLAVERAWFAARLARLPRLLGQTYTVLVVLAAWVLFRADTLPEAGTIYRAMLGLAHRSAGALNAVALLDRQARIVLLAGLIGATPALAWTTRDWRARLAQHRGVTLLAAADGSLTLQGLRLMLLGTVLLGALISIASTSYNPFIYFRF
jgi:alginate O-acetyltransferase complex protein AlgI